MFEMDDVNPDAEDRRILSGAYAHWQGATSRSADIKMTDEASAEMAAAIFNLLNRDD
jgi:hypothetical protein